MERIKEPLILLTKYSYSEADWICHFLSKEQGILSARLHSGKKIGKASSFAYQGGEMLEVEYLLEEGKDFIKIQNHKGLKSIDPEKLDYDSYLGLSFLTELTHKFGLRGIEPDGLFELILWGLNQKWETEQVALILCQSLWGFIGLSGVHFSTQECDHCQKPNFILDGETAKFRKCSYQLKDSEGALWCEACSGRGAIDGKLLKALWMMQEDKDLSKIPKEIWESWFPLLVKYLLWHHPLQLNCLSLLPKGLQAI